MAERAQRVALPVEAGEVRPPVTPHAAPWHRHHAEKNVASFTQLTLFACRRLQSQHPLLENVRGNKIIKRDSSPPPKWNFTHLLVAAILMECLVTFSNPYNHPGLSGRETVQPNGNTMMAMYSDIRSTTEEMSPHFFYGVIPVSEGFGVQHLC